MCQNAALCGTGSNFVDTCVHLSCNEIVPGELFNHLLPMVRGLTSP